MLPSNLARQIVACMYAIAYITHIAFGLNPSLHVFNQSSTRQHFLKFLENKHLQPFPTSKAWLLRYACDMPFSIAVYDHDGGACVTTCPCHVTVCTLHLNAVSKTLVNCLALPTQYMCTMSVVNRFGRLVTRPLSVKHTRSFY